MNSLISRLEDKVIKGDNISNEEAFLLAETDDLEKLLAAANSIRKSRVGKWFDLCSIMNAKSGRCTENCKFCAQSIHFTTGVKEYPLVTAEEALKMANENAANGVHRFSLVTSGRGISSNDLDKILKIFRLLKEKTNLKLCASLGIISYEQALKLKKAGVSTYHHNLEACSSFFPNICNTHTYAERIETIKNVKEVGMDVCSGGIFGLGESTHNRISLALEIRELGVKSIPINILNPIKGTPLENATKMKPEEVLKALAIFRFIIPDGFIRYAGGRKLLGIKEQLGLQGGINAALVGNYLTTSGNGISKDLDTIKSAGFTVSGIVKE